MKFTGERYMPTMEGAEISYEHWHRYLYATHFVKGKKILDIACGEGYGSYLLSLHAESVVGVDISQETINHASSTYVRNNLSFKVGSLGSIPIEDRELFDAIVSFETIEHVNEEEQEAFLREVNRLLKTGGIFIISTPNKLVYSDLPDYKNEFHQKEFYIDEFKSFLEKYFIHIKLLAQKIYPVSYIWNTETDQAETVEFALEDTRLGLRPSNEPKTILYAVALCSNSMIVSHPKSVLVDLSEKLFRRRDIQIAELQAELTKNNQTLDKLGEQLEKREQESNGLHNQLAERQQDLHSLRTQLFEKDRELQGLHNKLAEHDMQLNDLRGQLTRRDQSIRRSQTQAEEREIVLEELNSKLLEIYSSTAWKVIQLMWKFRLWLAPHESRRERLGKLLIRPFQKVKKEPKSSNNQQQGGTNQLSQTRIIEEEETYSTLHENTYFYGSGLMKNGNQYQETYEALLATARGEKGPEYVEISDDNLSNTDLPVKLIAFYLPQFHPFPENDHWWGTGFTEWTNVSKAVPQFTGHYQPHLPGELGFYDLRVAEVQRRQVELAKRYGIFGFCFYYYWFDGKRLLEKPLDMFTSDPQIDFPFCLCWANENWTRRWDGKDDEILISQTISNDSDYRFIQDISPYLKHEHYIHIDGRPLLIIYQVNILDDPLETTRRWREYAIAEGMGDLYLVAAQSLGFSGNAQEIGFDAALEFPPNTLPMKDISSQFDFLSSGFMGRIYDYKELVASMKKNEAYEYKLFKTVTPSWDNTPRRSDQPSIFINSTPSLYHDWLTSAMEYTINRFSETERFVYINAWNEWAEGSYLEPDRKYGYAKLQATLNALENLSVPKKSWGWKILFVSHDANPAGAQVVLLNVIRWFKDHTTINIKILCLGQGKLLPDFENEADTLVLHNKQEYSSDSLVNQVLDFCEGIPDLIYANTVASGEAYSWLSKIKAPIVSHIHELETSINRYAKQWVPDILKYSHRYIACSKAVRDNLVKNYDVHAEKCLVAYSFTEAGIEQPFDNEVLKRNARNILGLKTDRILIFGCGIGMPFRKGADLFIDAARKLINQQIQNFHFYWVGEFSPTESDPKYGVWEDYQQKLAQEGIEKWITFLGVKDNPKEYFQAGDIFVLTSREDPFPLVMLEAAECGLPIICFDQSGGATEFINDDIGFVVPLEDTDEFVTKITLLIHNEELRKKMGKKAREKYLSKFTIDHIVPQIFSFCRKVINQRPAVSIIIPNYNHEAYLEARLESIFNQTFCDFELIILDDGSTDSSVDIIKKYADRTDVSVIINRENSGSTFKQWLKGIDLAKAELVWIAESDDLCESDFLESLMDAFRDPQVKLAYAASNIIDQQGRVVGEYNATDYLRSLSETKWLSSYCVPANQEINEALGIKNTVLNISSALFRRFDISEKFKEILKSFRLAGDYYFIIHAIKGGNIYFEAKKLSYHRRHDQSVIGRVLATRSDELLREMAVVHESVIENFVLTNEFFMRWEKCLRNQWIEFYPSRPFNEINHYYPFDWYKDRILNKIKINK